MRVTTHLNKTPKRVNFVAIQQAHTVACTGYHAPTVRTGAEETIAHRVTDLFAYTAKKPGKITLRTPRSIVVQYDDGELRGVQLGRRYGAAAGLHIPHQIESEMAVGDTVEEGDAIAYNTGFFEPDLFNPKRVIMKNYMTATTVIWEDDVTLEDASSISSRVAEKLTTQTSKHKNIKVSFGDSISKLVPVGEKVTYESVLCIIQDKVVADSGVFNEQSVETLRVMDQQNPTAGMKGTVERIEVYYHGDVEDMSPSLRALAEKSDAQFRLQAKELGKPQYTGEVDSGFRIDGTPLTLDFAIIRVYITGSNPNGMGDKGVFFNQIKTVFSGKIRDGMVSEDGEEIDGGFGAQSIDCRIVNSPSIIGSTNTLLKILTKKMIQAYRS
jgi:hypothetical protein